MFIYTYVYMYTKLSVPYEQAKKAKTRPAVRESGMEKVGFKEAIRYVVDLCLEQVFDQVCDRCKRLVARLQPGESGDFGVQH